VYLDRSDIRDGAWEALESGLRDLVTFVEHRQPQLLAYGIHVDEPARRMTVVAVHPDSASLERHLEIGRPAFEKLAPLLELRAIEAFGPLSARAVELLASKAAALGRDATVTLHAQVAGFDRVNVPSSALQHPTPT
jgi:hypothetical protein